MTMLRCASSDVLDPECGPDRCASTCRTDAGATADRPCCEHSGARTSWKPRAAQEGHAPDSDWCTGSAGHMPERETTDSVTELLAKACAGDGSAVASVFPLIYEELHRLAQQQLRREPDGHTLSPTALVHEAYMRLIDYSRMEWTGRAHFMAVASTAMRRILVDHARSHRSVKRGGTLRRVPLESVELGTEDRAELLIAVDDALGKLKEVDGRQAQVVECRFFGGMIEEETAEALGAGLRTVKRDWAKAKSWLYREIAADDSPDQPYAA